MSSARNHNRKLLIEMTNKICVWTCRICSALMLMMSMIGAVNAQIIFSSLTLPFSPGGPYSVPRDTAVGTVLAQSSVSISANGISGLCVLTETLLVLGTEKTPLSGNYNTGVDGISVNFYSVNGEIRNKLTGLEGIQVQATLYESGALPGIEAELVVSGPVSAGLISNANLPKLQVNIVGVGLGCLSLGLLETLSPLVSNGTVSSPTCTVTTPVINVSLPTVATQSLGSVGSTTGDTTFTIGLSCQSGANVYVTLTDQNNPGNVSSLLSLNPSSTATGVKLRLHTNDGTGRLISFGPDQAQAGTTNQWYGGPSASTNAIPLKVQYYRDGSSITPGTVNAQATFTLSYQ
jgi:type 1 fimbria pilin